MRPHVIALGTALLVMAAHAAPAATTKSTTPADAVKRVEPRATRPTRPAGVTGTAVIPDTFLRQWDPLTIFFTRDVKPASGAAAAPPERLVTLDPEQPGAFEWLDARTLQFRPADPWPALARVRVKVEGRTTTLSTLMTAPVATIPRGGEERLPAVEEITLTFHEPLDAAALARMATIELRRLPGISRTEARWLDASDFTIKASERRDESGRVPYVLVLDEPIPLGTRVIVHLRLSLDDTSSESLSRLTFSTAEPFRIVSAGCADTRTPLSPEGTIAAREEALRCEDDTPQVVVELSADAFQVGAVDARNLIRLTPSVENLRVASEGRLLRVTGSFAWDTEYRVRLSPTAIQDVKGRPLEMPGASELSVYFPRKPGFLQWNASQGVVERHGAQAVPVRGRGDERLDLRVHAIDPLDRAYWPFPRAAVVVDESARPPGPGEGPAPDRTADAMPSRELSERLATLPAPPVSTLVTLPLRKDGGAATFGLDLSPHLARIRGKGSAGAYLVGIRRLDGADSSRAWMRVQVTDLTLSTVEEPRAVRFAVTSLLTCRPVPGAGVRLEGTRSGVDGWVVLFEGTTDGAGLLRWSPPGPPSEKARVEIRRIVVSSGDDVLVLDPRQAPDTYADNHWSRAVQPWLGWTQEELKDRGPQPEVVSHLFTERPVYRPDEPVHVKGWLRRREAGRLTPVDPADAVVVVTAPGGAEYRYPVDVTPSGSFYHRFAEPNLPTGVFSAHVQSKNPLGGGDFVSSSVSWRMEAYRLPTFEVRLHAPLQVPLDGPFDVKLSSLYYAGGKVSGRPVAWRVTQFPHEWAPSPLPGFRYSSDARYADGGRFRSSPRLEKADTTDDGGAATLLLDPSVEATAQPRQYVIEATVTGADDQTVTSVQRVVALPPFVLGLKAPRFLPTATEVTPELVVVGPDGKPVTGREVTVRLLHRQWHSHLRASDFSEGVAKYVTDVVDEKVLEKSVTSAKDPLKVALPLRGAGVYVVELESFDRLGRAQVVSSDFYAGGEGAVAWPKPASGVFKVASDRTEYDPGATAHLVLESPFQTAQALCVIEAPEGNEYRWLTVRDGKATLDVVTKGTWTPRLPVHVVLMRGRVAGAQPAAGSTVDLGKPATVAATAWVGVRPVDNQVAVKVANPERARPSETLPVTVSLAAPSGEPLAGEVTLWLVDQAVLALGKEQRLDPLPDLVTPAASHLVVRDTRNLVFGLLPYAEMPGGDGVAEEAALFDRTTIRKNFQPVPFYEPLIEVGPSGTVTVQVKLPDNLTNFKIRAKVASGPGRFGVGTSQVAVRLPVIVEPALPRFVRPGDAFVASAIGRIVEGEGGPGRAELQVEGLTLRDGASRAIQWRPDVPERLDFPVEVGTPPLGPAGRPVRTDVTVRVAVERTGDGARDAFAVELPVRDDRRRIVKRTLHDLVAGAPADFPAVDEEAREGTVRRTMLASSQPGLVRMAAALDFMLEYPFGCTEQRTSRARTQVALRRFRDTLKLEGSDEGLERTIGETQDWISQAIDRHGLVAYWPGTDGTVSLTAWAAQLLLEARESGIGVDEALLQRLLQTLQAALRSDYRRFIDGESWTERALALRALADAGQLEGAYAAELARKARSLSLEGESQVVLAFARSGDTSSSTVDALVKGLWSGVAFRLHDGRESYGGLQDQQAARSGRILPSETRTLAAVTRALHRVGSDAPRRQLLVDALVTLGRGDGWGSTNANAEALLALSEVLEPGARRDPERRVDVRFGTRTESVAVGGGTPVAHLVTRTTEPGHVSLASGPGPVVARLETSYVPARDGSHVAAAADGFVVTRELLRVLSEDVPLERIPLESPAREVALRVGDVIEEHVQVVNPSARHFVAVVVPLAAGMEPLNPALATAPPEAKPRGAATRQASYVQVLDDAASFFFDELPAGTYDLYFRTRAQVPGSYVQPAAWAELMYDAAVRGNSCGARVVVAKGE
jgi:hypothetical protein